MGVGRGNHGDVSSKTRRRPAAWRAPRVTATAAVPFWQTLTLGVVTALFGIVVLAWPGETLRVLGALVGVWLIVAA